MEDKVLFSTSFNGFNKQDVLNYIENIVDEYENKINTIKEELKDVKTALEGKTQLYEDILKKQQELGTPEELSEKVLELSEYKQKFEQNQEQYNQLKQEYNALILKNKEQNGEKNKSFEQLSQKVVSLDQELEEYRNQKQNIGSVLLRAQKDADELIFNTKKKCDQEVLKSQKYIQDLRRMFEKYSEQIKVEKLQITNSTNKINSEFDNIFDYVTNAHDAFEDIIGFLKNPEPSEEE